MISKDELVKMHDLCNAATPCPLSTGIVDTKMDPPKWFEEHLSFGSGAIYCVWCPEHPKTIDDKTGEPEHAVLFCITGNGPTSEVNAEFVVKARKWMPLLLDEIERLQAENAEIIDGLNRLMAACGKYMGVKVNHD